MGYAYRRARPAAADSAAGSEPMVPAWIVLALLAAASIWFSVLTLPDAYVYWLEQTFG